MGKRRRSQQPHRATDDVPQSPDSCRDHLSGNVAQVPRMRCLLIVVHQRCHVDLSSAGYLPQHVIHAETIASVWGVREALREKDTRIPTPRPLAVEFHFSAYPLRASCQIGCDRLVQEEAHSRPRSSPTRMVRHPRRAPAAMSDDESPISAAEAKSRSGKSR